MGKSGTVLICVGPSPRARAVGREGLFVSQQLEYQPIFVQAGAELNATTQSLRQVVSEISPGTPITPEMLMAQVGPAGPAIVDAAERAGADLIVMGALDRDSMFMRLWGSVARHVARSARCSVMLIPQPRPDHVGFGHVVADITLDAASLRMTDLALALMAKGPDSTIDLVHEFSMSEAVWAVRSQTSRSRNTTVEDYARERAQTEQQILDEFLSGVDLSHVQAKKLALPGRDGLEAIERARQVEPDLLIMPAPLHRLSLLDRVFHHPAEMALQRLPCRLLLYRERPKG